MAVDPVCGMQVEESPTALKSEYEGRTYYFCSPGCKKDFEAQPARYARKDQAQPPHGHHDH